MSSSMCMYYVCIFMLESDQSDVIALSRLEFNHEEANSPLFLKVFQVYKTNII